MKKRVITCENSHRLFPSTDELEEILEMTSCPLCWGEIKSINPATVEIGCPICNWTDRSNLADAICWLHEGCPNCEKIEEEHSKVYLVGSSRFNLSGMQAYRAFSEKDVTSLTRNGRNDYWEILVHFCQIDELISILDQGRIVASPTGYYRIPAVCLTETPLEFAKDIRKIHGEFGVAFKKGDIIRNGGMPALYIIESLLKTQEEAGGFCEAVKPYINLLRLKSPTTNKKKYDYLHEREWRLDKDIEFDEISPISIVLPESLNTIITNPEYIEKLQEHLHDYGEITIKSTKKKNFPYED